MIKRLFLFLLGKRGKRRKKYSIREQLRFVDEEGYIGAWEQLDKNQKE